MFSRLFVLGLVAAVISLASPCQSQAQDSQTAVFDNLVTGNTGVFTLDKFDPTRILPDGNPIGKLEGVLLVFTVKLKSGRYVLDNESSVIITRAWAEIGAHLRVWSVDPIIGIDTTISPVKRTSLPDLAELTGDINGLYDGMYPGDPGWDDAHLEDYSTGSDKLAAILYPDETTKTENLSYTDTTHLAAFTGTGPGEPISFKWKNSTHTDYDLDGGAGNVNTWSIPSKFVGEVTVVYMYAAAPEPASMGLLAAAFAPVLLRRLRKRKSRVS